MRRFEKSAFLAAICLAPLMLLTACGGQGGHEDSTYTPETPANGAVGAPDSAAAAPGHGSDGGGAQAYTIAEGSSITFVGSKASGSHEGGFKNFEGTIHLVGGTPEGSSVEVVIDAASVWSDADNLTQHLQTADFFDVETYPTATFSSSSVTTAEGGGYTVTGELSLHGETREVSFPADITVADDGVTATAELSINRGEFGITFSGNPDDQIQDEVKISFDLKATVGGTDSEGGAVNDLAAADAG